METFHPKVPAGRVSLLNSEKKVLTIIIKIIIIIIPKTIVFTKVLVKPNNVKLMNDA